MGCPLLLSLLNIASFYVRKNTVHYDDSPRRSSMYESDGGLIECTISGETELVTIPEFYKNKKCWHRFKDTVTFFHAGKGGGGTVHIALNKNRIGVRMNHPYPKENSVEELQNGPATTLIINVRDPVDRFVSAFRWRSIVLCKPDDERQAVKKGSAQKPHEKCKKTHPKEEQMLRETYRSDPSVLAEALCEDSPLREDAIRHYSTILHSMPLSEWLEFLVEPEMIDSTSDEGIENFIALPLEKQGDGGEALFEQHIQMLMLHLLATRYTQDKASAAHQTANDIIMQKHQNQRGTSENGAKWKHSSVAFHNATSTTTNVPPPSLSPLGECCLARHLEKDYRLIRTMIGDDEGKREYAAVEPLAAAHPVIRKACFWGSSIQQELCRSDLRSMLSRRARYLDHSLGACLNTIATAMTIG